MKINDTQAPAPDPSPDSSDVDASRDDDKKQDEASAFSRVLAKKQQSQQEAASLKGGKREEADTDTSKFSQVSNPETFHPVAEAKNVESKHVVELPSQLQQLVREVSVAAGKNQVQIEMNSNVLKGLNIRIERQNGELAIQFQTTSPEVSKLLSSNLDALSQGLADRGLSVADISITSSREASKFLSSKPRSGATQPRYQGGRR
jgi:flagellar hook-length control protein FliK